MHDFTVSFLGKVADASVRQNRQCGWSCGAETVVVIFELTQDNAVMREMRALVRFMMSAGTNRKAVAKPT